ncbi:MAG: formylglycine-generating enzyme family protein [Candidatus Acidiferrales bacterium]
MLLFFLAGVAFLASNDSASISAPVAGMPWALPLAAGSQLKMAWIAPGNFTMGSPATEFGRHDDETQFRVTLTHGFWMGATEVTVAQWRDVMGTDLRGHLTDVMNDNTLYDFPNGKATIRDFMGMSRDAGVGKYLANEADDLPMYFTSWNDAMQFCAKLTERERKAGRLPAGYKYTLPTEAQWEYTARAGTTGATFAGPLSATNAAAVLDPIAWYVATSTEDYKGKSLGPTVAGPRTVATKQPNPWGLYDMNGNLWEWCADWYGPYPTGSVTDPIGPATGTYRVNRGGSWGSGPADERSANRAKNPQPEASAWRGFRLALTYGD